MNEEEKIQELLKTLFGLKYDWQSSGHSYTSDVVRKEGKSIIESIIRSFFLDNRDEQKGILEAKVFMYEQIISKSNFAPMIKENIIEEKPIDENEK